MTVMRFPVRNEDVATLQGWIRSSSIRAGLAQRAKIVLLSGEGVGTTAVAERVGVSRPTVIAVAQPVSRRWPRRLGRPAPAGPEIRHRRGGHRDPHAGSSARAAGRRALVEPA